MFVKVIKVGSYTYLNLVESYRDDSGVSKHRVLYNFGRLDSLKMDQSFLNCVKKLCHLLEIPLLEDREKAALADCGEAQMLGYGHLAYARLWEKLGIGEILDQIGKDSRCTTLNLSRTVLLMAVQHLLAPRSKLGTYERQGQYWGMEQVPLQHLYRALDKLAANKERIETELFERNHLKLRQEVNVVFYDVTTFAFQSTDEDEVRRFGYSKDCKFNEVQVVMGLLLDAEGKPLGYELFAGNTCDSRTMVASLENLKRKFRIRKVVIVADRGLNSRDNLSRITEAGYGYLMACRLRSMPEWVREQALDEAGYQAVGEGFRYKAIPYVNRFKDEGKNPREMEEQLVLSWSAERAAKDRADRERLIAKAHKMLKSPASIEASSKRGGKKYLKDASGKLSNWALDEGKIASDVLLDGYYGIQTSEKSMSAREVMDAYHMLWRIEDSFRVMKSTMEVRPVFHWTPERIRGHFAMCFLGFLMERTLESLLPKDGEEWENGSPERIREALLSMQLAKVEANGETLYLKTKNQPLGTQIFKAVGLKLPDNVSRTTDLKERLSSIPQAYDGQITMF